MTRQHDLQRVCPNSTARPRRRGFSLLETMIAVGILGVGLIMVAAVFPVALTQHRESVDQARAMEMISKAESLLRGRIDSTYLWVDPAVTSVPGLDSPWYLLPTVNLTAGNPNWDDMTLAAPLTYADVINGATLVNNSTTNAGYAATYPGLPATNPLNSFLLFGLDIISDRVAPGPTGSPFNDNDFSETPNRMVWYGFYRKPAAAPKSYAAAICKQRRNQIFFEQDLTAIDSALNAAAQNPYSNATANPVQRRMPVPWRISVRYDGGNVLTNAADNDMLSGNLGLGYLAPVGSKLMIHGEVHVMGVTSASAPAGRVLTVSDIIDGFTVEFVGDLTNLPLFLPLGAGGPKVTFDLWIFPPSVENGDFGKVSPVLEWKVGL